MTLKRNTTIRQNDVDSSGMQRGNAIRISLQLWHYVLLYFRPKSLTLSVSNSKSSLTSIKNNSSILKRKCSLNLHTSFFECRVGIVSLSSNNFLWETYNFYHILSFVYTVHQSCSRVALTPHSSWAAPSSPRQFTSAWDNRSWRSMRLMNCSNILFSARRVSLKHLGWKWISTTLKSDTETSCS